jgi:xylitol oxidase
VANANLAAIVSGIELVTAEGDLVSASRETDRDRFNGMVLALGSLGIMTSLTLDIVPTFNVQQHVYDGLPDAELDDNLAEILAGGYSVSVFSDWKAPRVHQIWRKRTMDPTVPAAGAQTWYSATLADSPRNPVAGMPPAHATAQLGEFGPWNERLPHFRLDFTPSSGEELQSEYLLPRKFAVEALRSLDDIAEELATVLQVSELRTIAADDLWISPNYHTDTIAFHFTWIPDAAAVSPVLSAIEQRLAQFRARPHWGKVFNTTPEVIEGLYERLPDFRSLLHSFDPAGKFRNDLVDRLIPR